MLADRAPEMRGAADAGVRDGLWLGLAQAAALVPGVSRSGATLAAARARGFGRADASRLSWEVALPVLLGATALKGAPRRAGRTAGARRSRQALWGRSRRRSRRRGAIGIERRRPLWPWAAWRAALAGVILAVRQNRGR